MSRVLLVSHEATLSGAPRVAELAASCLVEAGHRVSIVSRRPGPLLAELGAVAPTRVEPGWRVRRRLWAWGGLAARLALALDLLVATATLLREPRAVVYLNSTGTAAYLRPARWLRRTVVLHVHESHAVMSRFLDDHRLGDLTGLLSPSLTLVACSPSVAEELRRAGAPDGAVHQVLSVPDERRVLAGAARGQAAAPAGDAVVVGACGAVEHRKGVDLWLQVADLVATELGDRVRFTWIGAGTRPAGSGGPARVEFAGALGNPLPAMARFDVMTLPSRDDPFPLVVLEAMTLGRPVVAFAVGGVAEQVGDAGLLVPAGDVEAFAKAVRLLVEDPALRSELGERARVRAADHFSRAAFARGLTGVPALSAVPLDQAHRR